MCNLCVVVVGPFVVGQLQLAEGDFLPHPVGPRVGRLRVHVHLVAWNTAAAVRLGRDYYGSNTQPDIKSHILAHASLEVNNMIVTLKNVGFVKFIFCVNNAEITVSLQ